ncbi:hypothetical protein D3C75_1160970 [compost metagenome]
MAKKQLTPTLWEERASLRGQLRTLYPEQADYIKRHGRRSKKLDTQIEQAKDALYKIHPQSVQRL